jgi:CelD/BcsL family acetyltransferase involved in cellulose biosynthesis
MDEEMCALSDNMLQFELIQTPERLHSVEHEWNPLLTQNAINEIFLTWQWQTTWWAAYKPGQLWVIAARDDSGALAGIAPWFCEAESQVIRPIGCVEVTDYLDVIAHPDHREAFLRGVVDWMADKQDCYSRINLCNNQDGSPTVEQLPRLFQERGFAVQVRTQEVCPIIELPGDFEAYIDKLDKKQRQEARRKLRRIEEDNDIKWYIVGPEHNLHEETEAFAALMAASHPEKKAFLDNPQHMAFFRAMVPCAAANGWLQMAFLTVNGERAAAYLNFDYDNRIMVYNSGLLPQKFGAISPGIVLILNLIDHAIKDGRAEFDFLRGNEEYKYRLGAVDRPVYEIQANWPETTGA